MEVEWLFFNHLYLLLFYRFPLFLFFNYLAYSHALYFQLSSLLFFIPYSTTLLPPERFMNLLDLALLNLLFQYFYKLSVLSLSFTLCFLIRPYLILHLQYSHLQSRFLLLRELIPRCLEKDLSEIFLWQFDFDQLQERGDLPQDQWMALQRFELRRFGELGLDQAVGL